MTSEEEIAYWKRKCGELESENSHLAIYNDELEKKIHTLQDKILEVMADLKQ